jgi:hypothetical protein
MTRLSILALLLICNSTIGQKISGIVSNENSKTPVKYVNIGIAGKNIGTVCNFEGKYSLTADSQYDNDILLFSSIGYMPFSIKIADLRKKENQNVSMKEMAYELGEVIIRPKIFKQQTLGVTSHYKCVSAGFKDNLFGYELGVLMKVKKTAFLKSVNINIASCTFDSIFYRLNIYKVAGDMRFENILNEPIFIQMSKEEVKEEIHIDLLPQNIVVDGDFLVTLEHIKDLGEGYLYFCAGITDKTYYRKTSQGQWETGPVGISISVDAEVEK